MLSIKSSVCLDSRSMIGGSFPLNRRSFSEPWQRSVHLRRVGQHHQRSKQPRKAFRQHWPTHRYKTSLLRRYARTKRLCEVCKPGCSSLRQIRKLQALLAVLAALGSSAARFRWNQPLASWLSVTDIHILGRKLSRTRRGIWGLVRCFIVVAMGT